MSERYEIVWPPTVEEDAAMWEQYQQEEAEWREHTPCLLCPRCHVWMASEGVMAAWCTEIDEPLNVPNAAVDSIDSMGCDDVCSDEARQNPPWHVWEKPPRWNPWDTEGIGLRIGDGRADAEAERADWECDVSREEIS